MQGSVPGSQAVAGTKKSFDLSNQSDALALLNHVRGTTLDPEIQNLTRNLILDYVTNPNDALFTQISENLSLIGGIQIFDSQRTTAMTTTAVSTPEVNASAQPFGLSRPRPRFQSTEKTSVAAPESTTTPEPTPVAQEPAVPTPEPAPAAEVPAPETPPVPTPSQPKPPAPPTPELVVEQVAEPESATTSTPEPVVPKTTPVTEAVPAASEPIAANQGGDPLARIKEIKKIVNEQVGNPVNLIDANNEVGREYMNALLDAMKKVHGGEPEAVTAAMTRLETAFAAVEQTLKEHPLDAAATATAEAPAATEIATPTPAAEVPAPETPPVPTPSQPKPPAPPTPEPVVEAASAPTTSEVVSEPAPEAPAPEVAPVPEAAAPAAEAVASAGVLHSLGDQLDEKAAAEAASAPAPEPTPVSTDPLMDPKITSGLDQLLSEWSLFKSSGLFGTGPSGREHPMFKTLAALPMSSVVSGRFEGASNEVKQSLTDYMNGWRYEQGMVHQIDETFEHYLRRVIQAILAKQPKTA